jgi:hypothetical protein
VWHSPVYIWRRPSLWVRSRLGFLMAAVETRCKSGKNDFDSAGAVAKLLAAGVSSIEYKNPRTIARVYCI